MFVGRFMFLESPLLLRRDELCKTLFVDAIERKHYFYITMSGGLSNNNIFLCNICSRYLYTYLWLECGII